LLAGPNARQVAAVRALRDDRLGTVGVAQVLMLAAPEAYITRTPGCSLVREPVFRSKTGRSQMNEVLCKILCHNICVVVYAIYEFGTAPDFFAQDLAAAQ
jgi:hypothetical protein